MFGYLLISMSITAGVLLVGFAMFLAAAVAITRMDSDNAADIINAMGKSFPLKGLWWRRK